MKLQKIILFTLICVASFQNGFGQEVDFEKNWLWEIKGIDAYHSSYDFRFYTKEDVVNAKRKFNLIKQTPSKDEWEGIYTGNPDEGTYELYWNSAGFIEYYFWHTLRSLDFGKSSNKPESVKFISEKPSKEKIKSLFNNNLVKVRFGNRHFLVPENRLSDFTERAVGLSIDLSSRLDLWQKSDDKNNHMFGLPILPKKYEKFLRLPIETEIISIGNREIYQQKLDDGTLNYEEVYRFVTLGAGKNKKIKSGMNFYVENLGEWVEITKVTINKSIGQFRRDLDENKQEQCFDSEFGQGEKIPCKEIKIGMKAKTKIGNYFF